MAEQNRLLDKYSKEWDVFISHASEDKDQIARPLRDGLTRAGIKVWFDEYELSIGDSLVSKIDDGLSHSRFGIVILSKAFFAKRWPRKELRALVSGEGALLPVWHGIDRDYVATYSPLLADTVAENTDRGLQQVITSVLKVMKPSLSGNSATVQPQDRSQQLEFWQGLTKLAGQSLGPYILINHIGDGGTGVVFRGTHAHLGTEAAVKILYPLEAQYADVYETLERGCRALAAVKHQNVVNLFDFGEASLDDTRKVFYLAMEYVAGQTLDQWSQALVGKKDAFRRRLHAAVQLASAIKAAHDTVYYDQYGFEIRGVLHGDLKPGNVLVNASHVVRIVDFLLIDIQRLMDPSVMPSPYSSLRGKSRRAPTDLFGTPGFMAPEQEKGGVINVRTDIYGLGITLFHAFLPESVDPVGDLNAQPALLPEGLTKLLFKMTSHSPDDRPSRMDSVIKSLRSFRSAG